MNKFVKFFHELLHPHCPDCIHELEDNKVCQSCETLKTQLAVANIEKQELLKTLLQVNKPVEPVKLIEKEEEPVRLNKPMPWNVRRQLLEQESARQAQIIKDKEKQLKEIEQLEENLLTTTQTGTSGE